MSFFRGFAVLSLVLSLGLWLAIASGYKIILSPSVPMGLWKVNKLDHPLRRGDFVWFCPPDTPVFRQARERGYLQPGDCPGNYLHLMKPVAAIPGDTVQIGLEGFRVNEKLLINSVSLSWDNRRRLLKHHSGHFKVQSGTVWLVSSFHRFSYDSRYFGPVELSKISQKAKPVCILKF